MDSVDHLSLVLDVGVLEAHSAASWLLGAQLAQCGRYIAQRCSRHAVGNLVSRKMLTRLLLQMCGGRVLEGRICWLLDASGAAVGNDNDFNGLLCWLQKLYVGAHT